MRAPGITVLLAVALAAACGSSGDGDATTSGSASGTSGGGGAPECTNADDCPPASGCAVAACESGRCEVQLLPAGTPIELDLAFGDCQRQICGADGSIDNEPDDADLPNDWNPCTDDTCAAGSPVHTSVADATPCGEMGGSNTTCVAGLCSNCTKDEDCPAGDVCHLPVCDDQTDVCLLAIDAGKEVSNVDLSDCTHAVCNQDGEIVTGPVADGTLCGALTFCHPSRCTAGACAVELDPIDGTADPQQVPGDCSEIQCDGRGGTKTVPDDGDAPADPIPDDCTAPSCSGGATTTANLPAGTGCAGGIDGLCDGNGNCT